MRGWTLRLVGLLAVFTVVGFAGLAGAAGWLYWKRMELRAEQATSSELAPLAEGQIPKIFSYDYKTVERSLTDVYSMLTPEYQREFEQRSNRDIIPQVRERQLVSQANVVGAGVLTAQRTSASVMVYLNRTVTDKSRESVYDGSRLRVDYQKVDGEWLINFIAPI